MKEEYTLGYSGASITFVERRRLAINGAFFLPYLTPDMRVLDCGCGPGTLTCDLAQLLARGGVVGLDAATSQIEMAQARAATMGLRNASFRAADVYALPFEAASFDAVFSHALMEHLADPLAAAREFHRVLKPGGSVGLCAPDWRGFLFSPETPELVAAVKCFTDAQNAGGGDVRCGHKLREYALEAGFREVKCHARYEVYDPVSEIIDLLVNKLHAMEQHGHVEVLQKWSTHTSLMFAQAWVSCVGKK